MARSTRINIEKQGQMSFVPFSNYIWISWISSSKICYGEYTERLNDLTAAAAFLSDSHRNRQMGVSSSIGVVQLAAV